MSKKTIYVFFLMCIVLITNISCQKAITYNTTQINKQYSIEIPSYFWEAKPEQLNPEASLSYYNYYRNAYLIVIDKPLSSFQNFDITQYIAQTKASLTANMQSPQQIDSTQNIINNLPAVQLSITGTVKGDKEVAEKLYYRIAYIQSKTHIYQIIIWSWDSYRSKFLNDFNRIVNSFKVL